MKTLILGIGRQGKRILELLIEKGFSDIYISDVRSEAKAKAKVEVEGDDFFSFSDDGRIGFLKRYDYIIDALPAAFSYQLFKSAAQAGSKIVSVSFLEEDFMELDSVAKESGALIVPDCGVAPGFSHLLAGYSVNKLGGADSVVMKLGAIPKNPIPPFNHNITWSITDLLEEYVRPARVRENGVIRALDPFDDIAHEKIFDLELESFITDGARSFLTSYPDVPNVEERTLRYKGHLDFMKTFKDSGFKGLARDFEERFGNLPIEDMFVMEIVATKSGKSIKHMYKIDYDYKNNVPALVNAVAITAVDTLCLIRDGRITEPGVFPLEKLATEGVYQSLVEAHKSVGAEIVCQN